MKERPIQEPEPSPPGPKDPEIDPMPEGPSSSDPVTASKQVDDRSRHESHGDPKPAPEQHPRADEEQGGKPQPGPMKA